MGTSVVSGGGERGERKRGRWREGAGEVDQSPFEARKRNQLSIYFYMCVHLVGPDSAIPCGPLSL